LRAVAILMVLVSHFQFAAGWRAGRFPLVFLIFDGELGVRIFFVISGFIITRLLLEEDRAYGAVSLRLFYARRALRILPIYFAYLGLLALLSLAGRYHAPVSDWLGCLTFTRNYIGRGDSATEHFWSLAIEEQFYLCWPLLFLLLRLGRRGTLALALLLGLTLAAIAVRFSPLPFPPGADLVSRLLSARSVLRYADSIALGCAGALLQGRLASRPPGAWPLVAALLLAAEHLCNRAWPALQAVHALMPALQAATVVLLLLNVIKPAPGLIHGILNRKLVARIGVLSYSLYVWHFVFLQAFAPRAIPWPVLQHWTVWWIPAAAVAVLSHEFLEKPFLRLRWRYRRAPSDQPA
jgi:peptidoglycan/LPS O-acetylase OafA/YrhL